LTYASGAHFARATGGASAAMIRIGLHVGAGTTTSRLSRWALTNSRSAGGARCTGVAANTAVGQIGLQIASQEAYARAKGRPRVTLAGSGYAVLAASASNGGARIPTA
jgi:hypothetical protein